MIKRIISLLLLLSVAITLISCEEDKTFSHKEISLVLTDEFYETDSENYDLLLTDGRVSVAVARISLATSLENGIPDAFDPLDFAEFFLGESGADANIYTFGDIPYYTAYAEREGDELYLLYTFYRSKYAYFVITYTAPRAAESEWRERFLSFADTVYFTA